MLDEEERKKVVKTKELWLDIGAKDRDEAAAAVAIGDPVTLELGYQEMRNNLANSPGMDDKTGLWVAVEALRRAKKRGGLKVALYAVATVQEEIGLRGAITSAYGVNPHVGIAVDVTHATDCPTIDKTQEGDIKLGGGPVIYRGPNMNPRVVDRLRTAAETAEHRRSNGAPAAAAPAPTPTPSNSPAAASRPASSACPTATCTARSK